MTEGVLGTRGALNAVLFRVIRAGGFHGGFTRNTLAMTKNSLEHNEAHT